MNSNHEKNEISEKIIQQLADLIIKSRNSGDSNLVPENSKIIEERKGFITYLMNFLKVSPAVFEPERIVNKILENIKANGLDQRLLYSEITINLYRASEDEKNNIDTNLNSLITYVATEKQKSQDLNEREKAELNSIILKFYDHVSLAKYQVKQIQAAVDDSKENVNNAYKEKIRKLNKLFKDEKRKAVEEISRKMNEESRNSQRGYVSTLGIFSAIMLAAFSSLGIIKETSSFAFQNVFNFLIVFGAFGSFVIVLICILLDAVFAMSDKDESSKKLFLGKILIFLFLFWAIILLLFLAA